MRSCISSVGATLEHAATQAPRLLQERSQWPECANHALMLPSINRTLIAHHRPAPWPYICLTRRTQSVADASFVMMHVPCWHENRNQCKAGTCGTANATWAQVPQKTSTKAPQQPYNIQHTHAYGDKLRTRRQQVTVMVTPRQGHVAAPACFTSHYAQQLRWQHDTHTKTLPTTPL